MPILEINIPTNKATRLTTAIKGVHPIPQIEDPENPGEFIDEFTDMEWAKKLVVNYLKQIVRKYDKKIAQSTIEDIDLES